MSAILSCSKGKYSPYIKELKLIYQQQQQKLDFLQSFLRIIRKEKLLTILKLSPCQKTILALIQLSYNFLVLITFFQINKKTMIKTLETVDDLSRIFPDIEGELCSRHSILFGKLKNTFNKVYDHMEPQNYIVTKGILQIFNDNDVELSMGLENGVILMTRQIDQDSPIYINGNHFDEELIMTNQGKLQQGLHSFLDEISIAIKAAIQGKSKQELFGGIFYVHSNIPEDFFNYKEILLISLFIGVSKINNTLNGLSIDQIIQKMAKYQIFGNQQFLHKLFEYQNREFTLRVGNQSYKIPLEKQNKMVLCQLDLAKQDINFQRNRKRQLKQRKQQILQVCKRQCGLDSILQIFQSDEVQSKLQFDNEMINQDQALQTDKFLQNSINQLGLLSEFNNGNITFQQLVSAQWELNSKYWKVHAEEVVQLVQQAKQALKINSCMIISETFALIVADKSKYTELLIFLRQKIHKGELKSKSLFKIQEQLVQHRWGSDKQIGQKMFTSVPSCGVSIFDPSEAIWFD